MQVLLLEGVYFDQAANFRASLPVNMWPVLGKNGLSDGYLRTAPGLTQLIVGPGQDRGSMFWEGQHFRVMGSKLCRVDGTGAAVLGDVGNDGKPVRFDYGFDRLAILSALGLYYWNGIALTKVTDPNLGSPVDMCWIDGYYMLTDGTNLYVTELNDPTTILPNASEQPPEDPSSPLALMRVRDEIYAVTTNSIQNFQNIGGLNFPFQVNPAGMISKGAVGTHAVCYFRDTLAFVGGGRNEAASVYLAGFGQEIPISTPEVDRALAALGTVQQAAIEIEQVVEHNEQRLLIHLPTVTLVYHYQASQAAEKPIWTQMAAGAQMNQAYPARHFLNIAGLFYGGSTTGQVGTLDETTEYWFGAGTYAQWDTLFLYNEGRGAILKSVNLVGTAAGGTAGLSWTRDGKTWGPQQTLTVGDPAKQMQWRPNTRMWNFMGLRFGLQNAGIAAFGRLEIDAEPLNA